MLKWFRLSNTPKWTLFCFLDEGIDTTKDLFIGFLPKSGETGIPEAIQSWAMENSIIATPTGSERSPLLQIHHGISRL